MANPTATEFDDTPDTIKLQLAMALGMGMGNLMATPGAVRTAEERLGEIAVRLGPDTWPQSAAGALAIARSIGQVAAALAAADCRPYVMSEDITNAWASVRADRGYSAAMCRC